VASFLAVLLNPLVVALQHWKIKRRGLAVAVVIFWSLLVFFGLALAFGYPLANGITHLADNLPRYVSDAENGRGWLGHLVRRYHVTQWVTHNVPKLVNIGQGLTKPALTLGKGALTLVVALFTIFILVLLLLLEGPKMRTGLLGNVPPAGGALEPDRRAGKPLGERLHAGELPDLTDSRPRRFCDPVHPGRPLRHPVGAVGRAGRLPAHDRGALRAFPRCCSRPPTRSQRGSSPWSSSWSTRRSRTTS
jgi:Predicted permease